MKTLEQIHIKEYKITGMTCKGCEANVKKTLEALPQIETAEISVENGEGKLYFKEDIPTTILQEKLSKIGNYKITEKVSVLNGNAKSMTTLEQIITKEYEITGMTCKGCEAKIKKALEALPQIETAEISVENGEGKLYFKEDISTTILQEKLSKIGNYIITEKKKLLKENAVVYEEVKANSIESVNQNHTVTETNDLPNEFSFSTYKPLFLIVGFILGVSILVQYPFTDFSGMLLMRNFMAGFFIVFAFFKLLNLKGFAMSYKMYDVVAAKWKGWGLIYPFVELSLGIAYLINVFPLYVNLITVIVLGISSIGVIKSNLDNKKIKCACLGDVFNLPMSTVTIIEDVSMVVMALVMLFVV